MPLATDDTSIGKVVGLRHYKEFCTAAKVEDQPGKVALIKTFRTMFNTANLAVGDEKEWVLLVAEGVRILKKSAAESFDWLLNFRQKQSSLNLQRFSHIVKALGVNAPDLIEAFGSNANVDKLKQLVTTFDSGLLSWIDVLPDNPTPDGVLAWANRLTGAQMAPKDVHGFWVRLDGVDRPTVWGLLESAPEFVCKAYQHAGTLPNLGGFWMKKMEFAKQKDRIGRLMQVVYHQAVWSEKPEEVNKLALALTQQPDIAWLKLFDIGQIIEIRETMATKADFLNKKFFQTAGQLAQLNQDPGKEKSLGEWLCDRCYYVAHLIHHGVTVNAIMAMFQHGFKSREMITCTWFQKLPPAFTGEDTLMFKVVNVHGGLIGRRSHLATRHLYQHFNFAEIKEKNSFHPRGTSISQMVQVANGLTLDHRNTGIQTIGAYCIYVGDHTNVEQRLVVSLYPNTGTSHRDFYWNTELERIQKVLPLVSSCQPLDFPT